MYNQGASTFKLSMLTHIQPANIHTLCFAALELATQSCPELVSSAQDIGDKFERTMLLFGRCHNLYNSASYLSDKDADDLGSR